MKSFTFLHNINTFDRTYLKTLEMCWAFLLQGCWHIFWVVHLMGDQRASWPDDVVFAIIYLPAAGKCRLNSNNYGKCHLERMMGLYWWQSWLMSYFNGGGRRAWWTFWATSVVWGLACAPLHLTLCDASPSPKTNNCKSNNWNFFSADTVTHSQPPRTRSTQNLLDSGNWKTSFCRKHES